MQHTPIYNIIIIIIIIIAAVVLYLLCIAGEEVTSFNIACHKITEANYSDAPCPIKEEKVRLVPVTNINI